MRQKRESDSEFMSFVHNQRAFHRPQLDALLLKPVRNLFCVSFLPLVAWNLGNGVNRESIGSLRSDDGCCIGLSVMRLFHVGHVVQTRRSVLSLAWHEWFSCKGKE